MGRFGALLTSSFLFLAVLISGCAAIQTGLEYRDLDVQTKVSATVFLPPAPAAQKTLWLDVRNASDKELDLAALGGMFAARGYRIVQDPAQANYLLQVNVLYVGRDDRSAIRQASLYGVWGGPIAGTAVGGLIGSGPGSPRAFGVGVIAGGLVGGAAELIAGSLVKKVTYAMVTDVQISERSATPVSQTQSAQVPQGTATTVTQSVGEVSGWRLYRTRIVSSATQVNLEFDAARAELTRGLLRSLANAL